VSAWLIDLSEQGRNFYTLEKAPGGGTEQCIVRRVLPGCWLLR
jgi:hypothetical protein